jgi:hypothetical protein
MTCLALANGTFYLSETAGEEWRPMARSEPPASFFATSVNLGTIEIPETGVFATLVALDPPEIATFAPPFLPSDQQGTEQQSVSLPRLSEAATVFDLGTLAASARHFEAVTRVQYLSASGAAQELFEPLLSETFTAVLRSMFLQALPAAVFTPTGRLEAYEVQAILITIEGAVFRLSYLAEEESKEPPTLQFERVPLFGFEFTDVYLEEDGVGWLTTAWPDEGRPDVFVSVDSGSSWRKLDYSATTAPWVWFLFPAFVLVAFRAGSAFTDFRSYPPPNPGIAVQLTSDAPISWHDRDVLRMQPIARALSLFVRNTDTLPPLTIAVNGPWGSGKSSMMNLVAEDLSERGAQPVRFNAWHHQSEENLLAALLENIREQAIPPAWSASGIWFRVRMLWLRFDQNLLPTLLFIAVGIVFAVLVFTSPFGEFLRKLVGDFIVALGTTVNGEDRDLWSNIVGFFGNLGLPAGLVAAVWLFLRLSRGLNLNPSELMSTLRRNARPADFTAQLGFRYRFAQEFAVAARALRSGTNPGLVIFVDDLDRCSPANAVEVLEALNFLVTAGPCFIFLGIDEPRVEDILAAQLAQKKPTDIDDDDRERARQYLKKLIQLKVTVPPLDAKAGLDLLLAGEPDKQSVSTAEAGKPQSNGTTPKEEGIRRVSKRWPGFRRLLRAGPDLILPTLLLMIVLGIAGTWPLSDAEEPRAAAVTTPTPDQPSTPTTTIATTVDQPASGSDIAASAPAAFQLPVTTPEDLRTPGLGWLVAPSVVALLLAILLLIRRMTIVREDEVRDSDLFAQALPIWHQVLFEVDRTPRGIKRIQNSLRLAAMRLRPLAEEDDLLTRLFFPDQEDEKARKQPVRSFFRRLVGIESDTPETGAQESAITDPELVALGAIQAIYDKIPDWTVSPDPVLPGDKTELESIVLNATRKHANADMDGFRWPPSPEIIKKFRAMAGEAIPKPESTSRTASLGEKAGAP